MLSDDYEEAAIRHLEDAITLETAGRLDNAGHLIGFAAECAIKFRIENLRTVAATHGHLPELLIAARKQLGARSSYTSMYTLLRGEIFKGWNVNRRYHSTGHTTQAEVSEWVKVTRRLFGTAGLRASK